MALLHFYRSRKGFTLIELIVMLAVLTILVAVMVPNYIILLKKAHTAEQLAVASEYVNAINLYNAMNPDGKIAGTDPGSVPTDDDITSLHAAGLLPVTEIAGEELKGKVLDRIRVTADGIAKLTNRNDIE